MSKVISVILTILKIIWELPQVIVSLFVLCFLAIAGDLNIKHERREISFVIVRSSFIKSSGLSLGLLVFLPMECSDNMLCHEYGHSRQAIFLGWIYLLAVGIPSLILYIIKKTKHKSSEWYHSKYPENWANLLGHAKYNFTE